MVQNKIMIILLLSLCVNVIMLHTIQKNPSVFSKVVLSFKTRDGIPTAIGQQILCGNSIKLV